MNLCKKNIFCTLNCCAEERFCGKQRIVQNDFVVQCTSKHIILLSLCSREYVLNDMGMSK